MVTVEDTDYSFEFSESQTANLHFSTASESIPFVMPLDSALEQLYGKKHFIYFDN